jgi:hypothetical protein
MFVAIPNSTPPPRMEICVIVGVNNTNIIHITFISCRVTARKDLVYSETLKIKGHKKKIVMN